MRGIPFSVPYIEGTQYAPGPQPNSPGNSVAIWPHTTANLVPWPIPVPSLVALANNAGDPRMRAPIPVVDNYALLPENYLFITGFKGKSQG